MIYTELTKKAMKLSFDAHREQIDKSGLPYVYHPYEVAQGVEGEYEICVALLHDVAEDTDISVDDIATMGFPREVTDALRLLCHDKSVPYLDYVRAIKGNEIARKVKISDLHHNSDLSRLTMVDEEALARVEKYREALRILEEKISD